MPRPAAPLLVLAALLAAPAAGALDIDWVTIGDPGNPPDDQVIVCCVGEGATGFGSVPYEFRIGRTEITWAEYAEFLNAVAASDPNRLYSPFMGDVHGGIARSGPDGSYAYTAGAPATNRPVGYVDYYRALRFANWVHNGQPVGPQDATTTEDGAYTLLGTNPPVVARNPGARVWLPDEDEWYKAAYHDPATGGYWMFPTGTNVAPLGSFPPGGSNHCNISQLPVCPESDTPCEPIDVGSYPGSASPWGTLDQCGNSHDMTETLAETPDQFIIRGSHWRFRHNDARATYRNDAPLTCDSCWPLTFRLAAASDCSDGVDNDGDGDVDFPDDAGCLAPDQGPEGAACDDGVDNDADGDVDFPDDAACASPQGRLEGFECDDGLDNDGDGRSDWDGAGAGTPDADCVAPWDDREARPRSCGLGFEVGVGLGLLAAARRRPGR